MWFYYIIICELGARENSAKLFSRRLKSGKTMLWCECLIAFGGKVNA
jgi:hypothetical protein